MHHSRRVVILYRGKIVAQDTVENLLRMKPSLPSLVEVFSQLTMQEDYGARAKEIVRVVSA